MLTGCLESKKEDESSISDDSGGDGCGGGTPTYTCDETGTGTGFRPADHASFANLTPGATVTSISFYFFESTMAKLGSSQVQVTATSCTFGGATLSTSNTVTVTTSQTGAYVKKTFTFSSPFTVPDCGGGVGTVGFLFTNMSINGSSTTFYVGAQKTANSSCQATVATGTNGTPAAHAGLYSYVAEIL